MLGQLAALIPDQKVGKHLLVDEGEQVIDVVRHHWIVYFWPVVEVFGALLLWVLSAAGSLPIGWLLNLGGLALIAHAVWQMLRERRDVFVITNMRVFRARGVFSVRVATMPIARILDITVDKPLVGRMTGYGHFIFETAAQEQGLRVIRYIGDPDARDLTIQRVVQRSGLRGPRTPVDPQT